MCGRLLRSFGMVFSHLDRVLGERIAGAGWFGWRLLHDLRDCRGHDWFSVGWLINVRDRLSLNLTFHRVPSERIECCIRVQRVIEWFVG